MANKNHLLAGILILGFILRVTGIHFGLPDLYHADEPIVVNHAMAFGSGDLNPHFFKIPPLVSYLVFFCFGLYFLIGKLTGQFGGLEDFATLFLTDPTSFYLVARIIFGAILGTFTILLLYQLINRYFSKMTALITALFFSVSFIHVRDSHYIYTDIPLLFVFVASFFPTMSLSKNQKANHYVWFGILLGILVATKYNGTFVLIPFLLMHFVKYRWRGIHLVFFAGILSVLTFGILNPYSVLDFSFFKSELITQAQSENFRGLAHHFTYSMIGGLGPFISFLSLGGMVFALFSKDLKRTALVVFQVSYFLVLSFLSQPYDRYVLPLVPFACFFAADSIERFATLRDRSLKGPVPDSWQRFVIFSFISLCALPTLAKAVWVDVIFLKEDVRTSAKKWVESHIPANKRIALDIPFYMPQLKLNELQLIEKEQFAQDSSNQTQMKRLDLLLKEVRLNPQGRYELYFLNDHPASQNFLFSQPTVPYDVADLRALGINYVIVVEMNDKPHSQFHEDLKKSGVLLAEFSPYKSGEINGPIDSLPLTGAPFLWKDLWKRSSNGQIIRIYELDRDKAF